MRHSDVENESSSASPWRIFVPPVTIERRIHHDDHLLLWQARGLATFDLDHERHTIRAGHALWLPVRTWHAFTVHANSVVLPVFFDATQTATTLDAPTVVAVDADLQTLLLAEIQRQNTIIQPNANITRQILSLIEESPVFSSALPMPTTDAALVVAETLRFNVGDDRTLDELAASVHTSPRTIERAFLAETGITFRQWRIRNRMEAAAILLPTATSLVAVANRVGYLNASAFGRVFKGHFGMTPSEYARRSLAQR